MLVRPLRLDADCGIHRIHPRGVGDVGSHSEGCWTIAVVRDHAMEGDDGIRCGGVTGRWIITFESERELSTSARRT